MEYRENLVYEMMCNRDYEGDVVQGGTVKIFSAPIPDAEDYTRGSGTITYTRPTASEQIMEIDKRKVVGLKVDSLEKAYAKVPIWEQTVRNMTFEISREVDSDLASRFSAAVPAANILTSRIIGTGLNDNAYETLVALASILDANNVPAGNRNVAVPPQFMRFLNLDQRYTSYNTGEAVKNLRNFTVGEAAGFTIHQTTSAPLSLTTYTIIAASKEAMTFADHDPVTEELPKQPDDLDERIRSYTAWGAKAVRPNAIAKVAVDFASL